MNTIQINLEIDPNNVAVTQALSNLILVMGGSEAGKHVGIAKEIKAVKETPLTKPEPAPLTVVKDEETESPESLSDTDTQETPADSDNDSDAPVATLEQIREVLGKKVAEHRDAIKSELTKHGAKNVSVLDAKHYDEFFAFLNKL